MLLHDNQYEQVCLRNELQHLSLQQKWSSKILSVQKKSFVVRQLYQQQRLRLAGLGHIQLIPNEVEKTHRDVAKFRSRHNGVKDLPPYQHLKAGDIHRAQDALFTHLPKDILPPSHQINNNETSKRGKELETNKMKDRDFSENGKYPPAVVEHVLQSHSQRGIGKRTKEMNLESSHGDLDYRKASSHYDDTKSTKKESDQVLPNLHESSNEQLKSTFPSQRKSISSQTDDTITIPISHTKRSSHLKLPSINVQSKSKMIL